MNSNTARYLTLRRRWRRTPPQTPKKTPSTPPIDALPPPSPSPLLLQHPPQKRIPLALPNRLVDPPISHRPRIRLLHLPHHYKADKELAKEKVDVSTGARAGHFVSLEEAEGDGERDGGGEVPGRESGRRRAAGGGRKGVVGEERTEGDELEVVSVRRFEGLLTLAIKELLRGMGSQTARWPEETGQQKGTKTRKRPRRTGRLLLLIPRKPQVVS
jgi:hypothetical protein